MHPMAKRFGLLLAALACAGLLSLSAGRADDKDAKTKEIEVKLGYGMTTKLKYQDLKEGKGTEAKKGNDVTIHYTGWLTDGTKFESSLDRGKPFTFRLGVGLVIPGWDLGLAGMKEGGKRKLTIPPVLAFGAGGFPPGIPANATLVFEVELLKVK
jgi:FKBP-type peptidyl-prolyl cis-trans isomerase